MSTAFIGQIMMFAGNFAPSGFAFCDGQLIQIQQATELFSLIGNCYGGDAITYFRLPDLRSRLPMHQGQGPGLSPYPLGEQGGSENVTLTVDQLMPAHSHTLNATATHGTSSTIGPNVIPGVINDPSTSSPTTKNFYLTAGFLPPPAPDPPPPAPQRDPRPIILPNTTLKSGSVGPAGNSTGAAHANMMPSLAIAFVIALQGTPPSRG